MVRSVLLAPLLGYRKEADWYRLEASINEADATKVRLLTLPEESDRAPEVREYIRAQLRALEKRWPRFEWDERRVELFSFEDCLHALAILFREEQGNNISIALGTSGGPGAVPATIACVLWGAKGIYVGDAEYGRDPVILPEWLQVDSPLSQDELRVLRLVADAPDGLDKKSILEKLRAMGRIRSDQDKHAYRRLSANFLPRLEEHGFVRVGPRDGWDGRHRFVTATDEGRRALHVLSPMLDEPRTALHIRGARRPRER